MECQDFFFGKYDTRIEDGADLSHPVMTLGNFESKRFICSEEFITRQLNRFLRNHQGSLVIRDGTSYPSFDDLVDCLDVSSVGCIKIYARTDVNKNVDATLACDIVMDEGIVSVIAHWTAYKEIRADEIVSTLLVPLHIKGLDSRTIIAWDNGDCLPLRSHIKNNIDEELNQIFILSRYPEYGSRNSKDDLKRFRNYVAKLRYASEVCEQGLKGRAAWKEWQNRMDQHWLEERQAVE